MCTFLVFFRFAKVKHLNCDVSFLKHSYVLLARTLYSELMILGIISFVIFLLNANGFFVTRYELFKEIEFAHIIIFYIGIGLVMQGLSLAIANSERFAFAI
jgi:hypothetical protein